MSLVIEAFCWVIGIALVFAVMRVIDNHRPAETPPEKRKRPLRQAEKRYVMRGYGGNPKTTTSLHPRQAKAGKRIVFIPGVGYRHVQATSRKTKT
jgi:hypothetical protein